MIVDMQEEAKYSPWVQNYLSGDGYQIFPYARGVGYPGETMAHLYMALKEEDALARVFYEAERRDLETVVGYFSESLLHLVVGQSWDILGAVWFTSPNTYRGNIGVWFRRHVWGTDTPAQVVNKVCQFAFATHKWQAIWALTPWKSAKALGERTGFAHIATLPGFVCINGKLCPMYVLKRENAHHALNSREIRPERRDHAERQAEGKGV